MNEKGNPAGGIPTGSNATNTAGGCLSSLYHPVYLSIMSDLQRIESSFDRMIQILDVGGIRR